MSNKDVRLQIQKTSFDYSWRITRLESNFKDNSTATSFVASGFVKDARQSVFIDGDLVYLNGLPGTNPTLNVGYHYSQFESAGRASFASSTAVLEFIASFSKGAVPYIYESLFITG